MKIKRIIITAAAVFTVFLCCCGTEKKKEQTNENFGENEELIKQELENEGFSLSGIGTYVDDRGCTVTIGPEGWPDIALSAVIPDPGYIPYAIKTSDEEFAAVYTGIKKKQALDYVESLKNHGFTIDDKEEESAGTYRYEAYDSDGYRVVVKFSSGFFMVDIWEE